MSTVVRCLAVFACLALLPSLALAQGSLSGVVRDTSGAVLPGVTVEAASPVLIEKVRTAVTDDNGRYQMIDLRPGAYTVTFTLAGFNTAKREDVALSGAGVSAVDIELRVGSLEETITVTGEAPTVDVSTTSRSAVLSADTIDALPSSRNYASLARMIPAAVFNGTDVGGSGLQGVGGSVQIHGSRQQDQRVTLNGINTMTLQAGGNIGGQIPDAGSATEVTVDHTAVSAELPTGGVRINFIPRDGGNRFAAAAFFTFTNGSLAGSNFTDELKAAGLTTPNEVKKNWDLNASAGGPIKRDTLWFWFSSRYIGTESYAPVAMNLNAYKPTEFLYAPSTERGLLIGRSYNSSLRATWQAAPKVKIAGTYKQDKWCDCPNGVSAVVAPEAARDFRFPVLRQLHGELTSPLTSRVLVEAVGMHLYERWGFMHMQAPARLGSRVRSRRPADDLGDRAVERPGLSRAGAQQQQHARAELRLPGGGGLRDGIAQLQDRVQPHARLPGDDQLQPECAGLPVQQRRAEPADDAGQPGDVPQPPGQRSRDLRPGQVDAEAHHREPGAAVRPLRPPASPSRLSVPPSWRRRGTSCSRRRTT